MYVFMVEYGPYILRMETGQGATGTPYNVAAS